MFFQLAEVLGVDLEQGWSLSTDRYVDVVNQHFILAGLDDTPSRGRGLEEINVLEVDPQPVPGRDQALVDIGPGVGFVVPLEAQVLQFIDGSVDMAVNEYGSGRSVYLAGLPYNAVNTRVLQRAIYWAAGAEERLGEHYLSEDIRVEVAHYPQVEQLFVYNNSTDAVSTRLMGNQVIEVNLSPRESQWINLRENTCNEQKNSIKSSCGDE